MPRLRPLKKEEDIAAVPETEPVLIELAPEGEALPEPEVVEPEKKVEKVEAVPEPEPEEEEQPDEKVALQKELERLTKAEEDSRNRVLALEAERAQAVREAETHKTESARYQEETLRAQYDAILNAMEANKAEVETAQGIYESALASSDFKAAAEAQRRISRAEAQIVRLEEGKDAFELRQKAPKKEEPKPVVDQFEASISNLPDDAKVWLRSHRDYMTDQRKNAKIQALHWDVLDEGHKPFTKGYFESLETHLGMRQAATEDDPPPKPVKKTPPVSAPVTREVISVVTGKPTSTRVELSPAQREAAKNSKISEVEYAKQVLKLQQLKKEGHYSESR